MVEIFKNWISAMLCIGIFITFIQLIIPKTNLKKYIYSLIGIVTILTVISPIINVLKNKTVEQSVEDVLKNISNNSEVVQNVSTSNDKYVNEREKVVKENFIASVKKDITDKLSKEGVEVKTVELFLNNEYDIEKIEIKINNLVNNNSSISSVNSIVDYINKEYDISYSKIEVVEG